MKKIYIFLLIISSVLSSCKQEVVVIEGKLQGNLTSQIILKLKSISGEKEQIIDTIKVDKGEFNFKNSEIKPPFRLTFVCNDSIELDVWIGEFGKKNIEIDLNEESKINLLGSFFYDELHRVQSTYNKMYIRPIKSRLISLAKLNKEIEDGKVLDNEEELLKLELEKEKKTAYRLRKKSILKTVRKNPNNPVSMGLMFDEFDRLTSWQKKEALKYMSKYFSDTGLNWQMKN